MASISRVYNKQQGILNNQGISVYGKLWKRAENGCGFKEKRKNRKGNGICRKDKKDTGRNRYGINEDTGGNEEASR